MLKIKLARIGKKGQPQYHIVISNDRAKAITRHIKKIGYYNPLKDPAEIKLDQKAYDTWIGKGARPTNTVRSLALKFTAKK